MLFRSPNPNNGKFKIAYTTENNEVIQVKLISLTGSEVYATSLQTNNGKNTMEIAVPELTKGIYLLNVITENGIHTQKLIID